MHDLATLKEVGTLHASTLDQAFLSSLGPRFLYVMYRAIDECEGAELFVERDGEKITGFVSGATSMSPIYRQMLWHAPDLLLALFPSLLNPAKLWQIFELLLHSARRVEIRNHPTFELLSIAVASDYRGTGVSERLYRSLMNYCKDNRISSFKIVVGEALTGAHRFYQRMGAEVVGELQVHRGRRSLVYIQRIE